VGQNWITTRVNFPLQFTIIHNKPLFSKALADYLIYYNTQRPHKSLGLKTPLQLLISQGQMSQMCVTQIYLTKISEEGYNKMDYNITA